MLVIKKNYWMKVFLKPKDLSSMLKYFVRLSEEEKNFMKSPLAIMEGHMTKVKKLNFTIYSVSYIEYLLKDSKKYKNL
tara:strand:- start:1830 stop:2063 length:234 start_codon:yes stop_codon:yes gene_type:complete